MIQGPCSSLTVAPTRLVAKALCDPFYAALIRHYGADQVTAAGFFDDGAPCGTDMASVTDLRLLVTPVAKVGNLLAQHAASGTPLLRAPVVLLASGAFCPIHSGHLLMMESAKRELERRGRFVVGGFLAPDHDGYVGEKCGAGALPSCERVHLAQAATSDSAWLSVDPWAALYLDRAVNFTDIIRRLTRYLGMHLRSDIEVAFVCGGDNAGFSRAFREQGMLVIVPRGATGISVDEELLETERVLVAQEHVPNGVASRAIRAGSRTGVVPRVAEELERLNRCKDASEVTVRLRDEEQWLVEPWMNRISASVLVAAQRDFASSLQRIVKECLQEGYRVADTSVTRLLLSSQRDVVRRFAQEQVLPIISLDACISGDISVGISRHFELTSGERCQGLFPRPGSAPLSEQVSCIPPGRYILMDDDIATGRTVRDFIALLPAGVLVDRVVSIHQLECAEGLCTTEVANQDQIIDVGDVRDFLVGAREGGLVVRLPNGRVGRVPYLAPYVTLFNRMSFPISQEKIFSERVWQLNARFFECLPVSLRVDDASESFQELARYLGFLGEDSLAAVCKWHAAGVQNEDLANGRLV